MALAGAPTSDAAGHEQSSRTSRHCGERSTLNAGQLFAEPSESGSRIAPKVCCWRNIQYAQSAERSWLHWRHPQTLDIFTPPAGTSDPLPQLSEKRGASSGQLPVMVFVHGGGWLLLTQLFDQQVALMRSFAHFHAKQGWIVVQVRYRTSSLALSTYALFALLLSLPIIVLAAMRGHTGSMPSIPILCSARSSLSVLGFLAVLLVVFLLTLLSLGRRLSVGVTHPAHAQDVACALRWVYEHIGESKYGGDAGRVFLCGHSAGGHLAALVALDPMYAQQTAQPTSSTSNSAMTIRLEDDCHSCNESGRTGDHLLRGDVCTLTTDGQSKCPRPAQHQSILPSTTHPQLKGAIIISGVLDLPRLRSLPVLGWLLGRVLLRPVFGAEEASALHQASPIAHAHTSSCPMLFVNASHEFWLTDFGILGDARRLTREIIALGGTAEHVILHTACHFSIVRHVNELARESLEFFTAAYSTQCV